MSDFGVISADSQFAQLLCLLQLTVGMRSAQRLVAPHALSTAMIDRWQIGVQVLVSTRTGPPKLLPARQQVAAANLSFENTANQGR